MTVLNVLQNSNIPLDVPTVVSRLGVNKTTVYRQIEKLLVKGKILEADFGDGKKRYEVNSGKHHHHLICENCSKLEDIQIDEKVLLNQVSKSSKFRVLRHNLEFFGLCEKCL